MAAAVLAWGEIGALPLVRDRVEAGLWLAGLTLGALWLWVLLGSGWSPGLRLGLACGLLGGAGVIALGWEVRGTSLDGVPHLVRRGTPEPGIDLAGSAADIWSDVRRPLGWPAATAGLDTMRRHWRTDVGAGLSGFVAVGAVVVTQEQRGPRECVVAYDRRRGSETWSRCLEARHGDDLGVGPRSTPAVDATGRLYALGAGGDLRALAAGDGGRPVWQRSLVEGASPGIGWAPPLVLEGGPTETMVLVALPTDPGQLIAVDGRTGETRWQVDTPVPAEGAALAEIAGLSQVVVSGAEGAAGYHAGTGLRLWQLRWPASVHLDPAARAVGETRLLLGGGRGGVRMLDVQKHLGAGGLVASRLWRAPDWRPWIGSPVLSRGQLVGLDDGTLGAWDSGTGFRLARGARLGPGRVLPLPDGEFLVLTEAGWLHRVRHDDDGFVAREAVRAVATDRVWGSPLLDGRWLVVRGDGEAALWELPPGKDDPNETTGDGL